MDKQGEYTGRERESVTAFESPTFDRDVQIRVGETVGSASISPSGRDVVLASREGLHIIDLDFPYSPPRHLAHYSPWEVADVQWSPFASRDYWIVSTSNQKALVWNLELPTAHAPIEHTLHAHSRAITDINFSAHHPDILVTCAVDSYVHCWDLRRPARPAMTFADWNAGATQVKWNRQDEHIIASSHDKFLRIWDDRKGAYPLKSIEAHTTKIYGVDWNRTRSTALLTCSLDKTIKFWDFSKEADEPERVIRTVFPVWRARHTPFGWGVLAMPQRGNYDLHLYDRRLDKQTPRDGLVKPVHSFEGHSDQVKEFLWRARGGVENGIDNRDFQLISWGMDKELHLHRMDSEYLQAVGHEKGKEVQKRLNFTRKGAIYKTFHDESPKPPVGGADDMQAELPRPLGLGALVSAAGMSKAPLTLGPLGGAGFAGSSISMYGRRQMKRTMNPIKWMEGVKMGHRRESMLDPFLNVATGRTLGHNPHSSWDTRESLSDEMTYVAKKYKKVNFEKADVHRRLATVTLHGPWAAEGKPAFLRVSFEFPDGYPVSTAAVCTFERTTAAISEDVINKLSTEVKSIMSHYLSRKVGCLEALIIYLLGERDLEQSIALPVANVIDEPADESSSDEDPVGNEAEDLETSATDTLGLGITQANVPLPKACGAYWSNDGRLVCFFPPKPEPKPLFNLHALRSADRSTKSHRQFEGFGRFMDNSPSSKERMSAVTEEEDEGGDETSSIGSFTSSSSSSSSGGSDDISRLPARFKPPSAWRAATLKFHKSSSHSSGGQTRQPAAAKPKSIISIHDFSSLLPAKKTLAEQYRIFGPGPEVCHHNSEVADRNGLQDLATVWKLCEHILYDKVPLEIMEQALRKEPILVLAKRSMVRVKRRDSAVDLQFDDPQSVANPSLTGRVKWGKHPLASSWLIPALFAHFEKMADIQMLGMLSCLFWEPAAREGVPNALMKFNQEDLPVAMKTPAFSLDYFPSRTVAWSLFQNRKAKDGFKTPPVGSGGHETGPWDYFSSRLGVYGSAGSSNGPWSRDMVPSEPITPYSTGNTPPEQGKIGAQNPSFSASLSTSPELSQRSSKRSTSNLSATLSSFNQSFPLTASSSPNDKHQPETDLSTSAPSGGITWGSTTIYSTGTTPSPERRRTPSNRRRSSTFDSVYDSSDDDQPAFSSTEDTISTTQQVYKSSGTPIVKMRLKNQHLFDDDAYASTPLLNPQQNDRYIAYREIYAEQLSMWDLAIPRAEILKFNGLASYWPFTIEKGEKEDVYPRSGTQQKTSEPRQSLLTMAAAQQQGKTLHSPSSTNASPRLAQPRPGFANTNGSTEMRRTSDQRLNPAAKPFIPQTSTQPLLSLNRPASPSIWLSDEIMAGDQSTKLSRKPSCVICWQPIMGLSCYCPSGNHLLHSECLASLDQYTQGQDNDKESLDCLCPGIPALPFDAFE